MDPIAVTLDVAAKITGDTRSHMFELTLDQPLEAERLGRPEPQAQLPDPSLRPLS